MSNGIPKSIFSNTLGWGVEDTEKAQAMLKRERPDGSKRFTIEYIAQYTGMPVAKIESISRNMRSGDPRQYIPSRLVEDDYSNLFHEAARMRENAIKGSRALADRIRAVHG